VEPGRWQPESAARSLRRSCHGTLRCVAGSRCAQTEIASPASIRDPQRFSDTSATSHSGLQLSSGADCTKPMLAWGLGLMDVLLWYSIFSWVLVCVSVRTNSRN